MLKLFSCHSDSAAKPEIDKDYDTVNFDIHTPTYIGKYLGCEELYRPGLQDICETVRTIYRHQKPRLKSLDHYSVTLSKDELSLRDRDSTEDEERVFGLRRILYCGVYRPQQKIFFFNYQFGPKGDAVNCHVILLPNKEEAKSLAKVIQKAFHVLTHELHVQDVQNRRLHARGLSESSLPHLHVNENSRNGRPKYYNLKESRSQSLSSSAELGKRRHSSDTEKNVGSEISKDSVDSIADPDPSIDISRYYNVMKRTNTHSLGNCSDDKSKCLLEIGKFSSRTLNKSAEWDTTESARGNESSDCDGEKIHELRETTSDSNLGSSLCASMDDITLATFEGSDRFNTSEYHDWQKLLELKETDL